MRRGQTKHLFFIVRKTDVDANKHGAILDESGCRAECLVPWQEAQATPAVVGIEIINYFGLCRKPTA